MVCLDLGIPMLFCMVVVTTVCCLAGVAVYDRISDLIIELGCIYGVASVFFA